MIHNLHQHIKCIYDFRKAASHDSNPILTKVLILLRCLWLFVYPYMYLCVLSFHSCHSISFFPSPTCKVMCFSFILANSLHFICYQQYLSDVIFWCASLQPAITSLNLPLYLQALEHPFLLFLSLPYSIPHAPRIWHPYVSLCSAIQCLDSQQLVKFFFSLPYPLFTSCCQPEVPEGFSLSQTTACHLFPFPGEFSLLLFLAAWCWFSLARKRGEE